MESLFLPKKKEPKCHALCAPCERPGCRQNGTSSHQPRQGQRQLLRATGCRLRAVPAPLLLCCTMGGMAGILGRGGFHSTQNLRISTYLQDTFLRKTDANHSFWKMGNGIKNNKRAKVWRAAPVGTPGSLLSGFRTALKQPHEHLGLLVVLATATPPPSHSRSPEGLDGGELLASQRQYLYFRPDLASAQNGGAVSIDFWRDSVVFFELFFWTFVV